MDKSLTALPDLISIKSGRTSLALTVFRLAGNEPENSAPQSFLSAQGAVAHA